jgi:rhodanese-related sulfurtransferase
VAEIKTVSPQEAQALLEQGYTYVDVRSEQEFEQGHVPGSLNLPLMLRGPAGLTPNPEFMDVAKAAFRADERLIIGCKSGSRSRRAAELLLGAGFQELCDLSAGFDAGRDPFGRVTPGWSRSGLAVETGKPEGSCYADVKRRTPGG